MPIRSALSGLVLLAVALSLAASAPAAPHTTYLWHMHQPIYWPDRSVTEGDRTERAYETIQNGNSENDEVAIFGKPDRVAAYQWAPKDAVQSILGLPYAGAQLSFAGALIENLFSLGDAGWAGGTYASNWYQPVRDAMAWTDAGGISRMDAVLVGAHHGIYPLMDENAFRMELQVGKEARAAAWGAGATTRGFFPAEMCFSQRMIPTLVAEGVDWVLVPDVHIARACADYPSNAQLDNCDPPNPADQLNPAQGFYYSQTISRGVTTRVPPMAFRPHHAEYVDPATGAVSRIIVVPVAMAMSWNEGYGLYGTGEIDAIASLEDPSHPFLFVFAHDGDNAWAGGFSYYNQNVNQFSYAADAAGYEPSTIERYLVDHPVAANDVVHVEDGGWVNADGDFGSPQYINWNWPLVDAAGNFDIPNGWAEDERNWAVLTAAQNRVETAEALAGGGAPAPADVWDPTNGASAVEKAWHFLLAGYESGYMYYGTSLDMEVKPTLACNQAVSFADPVIAGAGGSPDTVAPTVWLPQRLPWNPGGFGGGALWGYPGGNGTPMDKDFHVWTFAYDVSGLSSVELKVRVDTDGVNSMASTENETYAGGPGVSAWQTWPMNFRDFPDDDFLNLPGVDFTVLPTYIADQYWVEVTGFENQLLDYYIEAVDTAGNVKRTPIQHVWVGDNTGNGGGGSAVSWTPENPEAGGTLTITYEAGTASILPPGTDPVYIHVGHSGWQGTITPDPAMTDEGGDVWSYTYAIPAPATSVDFVFNDGAGNWDNNGGADWHVPVTGGAPGFAIDGALDPSAAVVAADGDLSLHAAWDGTQLYVATNPVADTPARDHFLFVAADLAGTGVAPWAKAGSVAGEGWFLANEDGNDWSGWFGFGGNADPGSAAQTASGAVLEGTLDLTAVLGSPLPAQVWLAVGQYGTNDADPLEAQLPTGNGDGDLGAAEWVSFPLGAVGVSETPAAASLGLRAFPNPFREGATLTFEAARAGVAEIEIFDVAGRRVTKRIDSGAAGARTFRWDGRDDAARPVASGVYWARVRSGESVSTVRVVKVAR